MRDNDIEGGDTCVERTERISGKKLSSDIRGLQRWSTAVCHQAGPSTGGVWRRELHSQPNIHCPMTNKHP